MLIALESARENPCNSASKMSTILLKTNVNNCNAEQFHSI
jgi:hypothetical protein